MRDTALRKQAAGWHFCPSSGVREVMRSEVLRDVLAGCAGVLAVAALIGLPGRASTGQQPQFQYQHAELLPYFHRVKSANPEPPAPHTSITTRP
jgi:hypothetical protein